MSIGVGISEVHVTFYGGKISVGLGVGGTRRGTEKSTKTPFIGFQELVDAHEIGANIPKDAGEFPPRVYLFFRKKESVDVVIRALEKLKVKIEELEAEAKITFDAKESKDDSKQGIPT